MDRESQEKENKLFIKFTRWKYNKTREYQTGILP